MTQDNAEAFLRLRTALGDPRDLSAYQDCIAGARAAGMVISGTPQHAAGELKKYMIGPGGKLVVR